MAAPTTLTNNPAAALLSFPRHATSSKTHTASFRPSTQLLAVSTGLSSSTTSPVAVNSNTDKIKSELENISKDEDRNNTKEEESGEGERMELKDYFEQAKVMIRSDGGNGHGLPRWFSPLDCGSRLANSPLLLYLPGIDGVGLGLILQHQGLGKIFDVWCLHIPVKDRTPFEGLVLQVEQTVRSQSRRSPGRPIYLVGECIGGCLALAVAARNPDIDLVLILANPATSYAKSQLPSLLPLLQSIPSDISPISLPYTLSLMTGDPLKMMPSIVGNRDEFRDPLIHIFEGFGKLSSYISVLADILPRDTLLWKLRLMKTAASFANSRLHAVKAEILILSSGSDPLLPNLADAERIHGALPKQKITVLSDSRKITKCEIRTFSDAGHFIFLENGIDLVSTIKGAGLYRRAKNRNHVSDYLPLTNTEFKKVSEPLRWIDVATGPVMLSTMEDGKIVRGLAGIPAEGPVVFVGYHMLMGLELFPLVQRFMVEKNILLRGLAHPMIFTKSVEDQMDLSMFDSFRMMGAVPVTPSNFYNLLSSGSHVLLYPGGMREALHRKGEEYQLFWPERSEFVRMAAKFGAKIIPFGVVGEDDVSELMLDYEDQIKIPFLRDFYENSNRGSINLRDSSQGEVGNQVSYLPGLLPKLPGRFYYLFSKPIETTGIKQELRNKEKAHELYQHVKSEVERCISYLKEKREKDPYRSLVARMLYQGTNGWTSEVPTFELE